MSSTNTGQSLARITRRSHASLRLLILGLNAFILIEQLVQRRAY
jgi:hypothetical protein